MRKWILSLACLFCALSAGAQNKYGLQVTPYSEYKKSLKTNAELKMPTGYDSFTEEAWPTTLARDPEASKNRALLIKVMEKHGFKVSASEWWHFDFTGWQKYEVMDIDFE